MANIPKFDAYKLETKFYDDRVVHETSSWELSEKIGKKSSTWVNLKLIGSGGFGAVWLEKEEKSGQLRAVKKLNRGALPTIGFSRELLALIRLADHEHLFVKFFGWYENRDIIFIAMEYLEYGDLSAYIKDPQNGREETQEITKQILEGIKVLHEEKICHRDLKPQNVLIACKSPIWVKIADFGASKRVQETALRTRLGTEGYLAPELLGALPRNIRPGCVEEHTHALDIWSLGCLVHELLTSETPFLEANLSDEDFPNDDTESGFTCSYALLEPAFDTNTFFGYCSSLIEFPMEALQKSEASEEAGNFVKRLLVANPANRPTAAAALEDPWLTQDECDYISDWTAALKSELLILQGILGINLRLDEDGKSKYMRRFHRSDIMKSLFHFAPEHYLKILQHAITAGLNSVVEKLLQSSSIISVTQSVWGRILQQEIKKERVDMFELLLSGGGKMHVNVIFEGRTPLQAAAESGNCQMANLLLAHKANVDVAADEPHGRTALQTAAESGHIDMAKLLLAQGADINMEASPIGGRTALQAAAGGGHIDMAKLLLSQGADINIEASRIEGRTALQAAAGGGHIDMAKLLLSQGADINIEASPIEGRTALQAAAGGGHIDMAKLLLSQGADINIEASRIKGRTALQAAAGGGHIDMVELLLTHGAHINAVAGKYYGRTALQAAAGGGHMDIAELLLDRGARVNVVAGKYYGRTALQAAAGGGHLDIAKILLVYGADHDAQAGQWGGRTALQAAAENGHIDMAKMLLIHGVDLNEKASRWEGRTAVQAAIEGGHTDMTDILLRMGTSTQKVNTLTVRRSNQDLARGMPAWRSFFR